MFSSENIQELSARIAQGDQQALGLLFKSYYGRLFGYIKTIVKNNELAEETVADVFLKLWNNRQALLAVRELNYYLFTIAKHAALDCKQRNEKHLHKPLAEEEESLFLINLDPESLMIDAEAIAQIQMLINTLPPRCKLIFRLVKEEGLKYREVAALLDLSVKTVEVQMSLAFSRLGTALDSHSKKEKKVL